LAAADRLAFADVKARFFDQLDRMVNSEPFVAQSGNGNTGARGDAARQAGEE
jgi:hypothetical protein